MCSIMACNQFVYKYFDIHIVHFDPSDTITCHDIDQCKHNSF